MSEPIPPQGSYERKAALDVDRHHLLGRVMQHPMMFREIHSERWINNLYLDSPQLTCYWDNEAGVGRRYKLRVRWYGDEAGALDAARLEVKVKQNELRVKHLYSLAACALPPDHVSPLIEVLARAELPGPVRSKLLGARPVLLNRYRRKYLLSYDGQFRLTLDWALTYRRVDAQGRAGPTHPSRGTVFELKHEQSSADADGVMSFFPFRLTKHSKYAIGVERLFGV